MGAASRRAHLHVSQYVELSMMRRMLLYTVATLPLMAAPLHAQQPTQQAKPDSVAVALATPALIVQAQADGTKSGRIIGTGGWFAGGFVSGLLLGVIGTGITWALASSSDVQVPPDSRLLIINQPITYQQVYEKSFADKVKMKRKSSALRGGLVGTGIGLVLFIASVASHQ